MNPGPERSTSLKVDHLNARSINISRRSNVIEKFSEINSIILNENFNIFALSETWLNASIPNRLFDIPGFHPLIRLGRSDGRRAEGVALYVSSEFAPRRLDLETNEFELLWVEVKIIFFTFICRVCYRPEYASNETNMQFLENLQSCIDKINQEPDTFLVLLGDYFNSHYDSANPSECSDFGCLLYRWFECKNLYQVITELLCTETQHSCSVFELKN